MTEEKSNMVRTENEPRLKQEKNSLIDRLKRPFGRGIAVVLLGINAGGKDAQALGNVDTEIGGKVRPRTEITNYSFKSDFDSDFLLTSDAGLSFQTEISNSDRSVQNEGSNEGLYTLRAEEIALTRAESPILTELFTTQPDGTTIPDGIFTYAFQVTPNANLREFVFTTPEGRSYTYDQLQISSEQLEAAFASLMFDINSSQTLNPDQPNRPEIHFLIEKSQGNLSVSLRLMLQQTTQMTLEDGVHIFSSGTVVMNSRPGFVGQGLQRQILEVNSEEDQQQIESIVINDENRRALIERGVNSELIPEDGTQIPVLTSSNGDILNIFLLEEGSLSPYPINRTNESTPISLVPTLSEFVGTRSEFPSGVVAATASPQGEFNLINIRQLADVNSSVISTINRGEPLMVLPSDSDWYQVYDSQANPIGWVNRSVITININQSPTALPVEPSPVPQPILDNQNTQPNTQFSEITFAPPPSETLTPEVYQATVEALHTAGYQNFNDFIAPTQTEWWRTFPDMQEFNAIWTGNWIRETHQVTSSQGELLFSYHLATDVAYLDSSGELQYIRMPIVVEKTNGELGLIDFRNAQTPQNLDELINLVLSGYSRNGLREGRPMIIMLSRNYSDLFRLASGSNTSFMSAEIEAYYQDHHAQLEEFMQSGNPDIGLLLPLLARPSQKTVVRLPS